MGPAEVKLGQAINSYGDAPEYIRQPMGKLKGSANPPSRWELESWIQNYVPSAIRNRISRVGEILGSGSYFVAPEVELDGKVNGVLRILRPNARERAEKGFERLIDTACALQKEESNGFISRLFSEQQATISSALSRMVKQAQKMSSIETNMEDGAKQVAKAHAIYDGYKVQIDGYHFSFQVTPWLAYGKDYALMQKAPGKSFSKLPLTDIFTLSLHGTRYP